MPPANTFKTLPEAHCQAPATYYHLQVPAADGIFHLSPFLFLDQYSKSPLLAGYQSMFDLTTPISPHSWGHPLATTSLPNPISYSSDSNHLKDWRSTSEDKADNLSFEFDDFDCQWQVSRSISQTNYWFKFLTAKPPHSTSTEC